MASSVHEQAKSIVNFEIVQSNPSLFVPLDGPVFWTGNTKFIFVDDDGDVVASYEGDEGLMHHDRDCEFPTAIKEVLFTQSETSAYQKVKTYFAYSKGQVKVVILVIIRASKPPSRVLEEIRVEKWNERPPTNMERKKRFSSGIHQINPQNERDGFYVVKKNKVHSVLEMTVVETVCNLLILVTH